MLSFIAFFWEELHMFLCIDPGSKYLGYKLIANYQIFTRGLIIIPKQNILQELEDLFLKHPQINTILMEKGEHLLREYETLLINFFKEKKLKIIVYQAKQVRKKLKLERHPSSLSIIAKENLIQKTFPTLTINNISIHEIDSALLYIYNQRTANVQEHPHR